MSGFFSAVIMAVTLGAASFGTGMLPLSIAFSKLSLELLTVYGTGLLLGAALGVVIPEGVETLASALDGKFPTHTMAACLLAGFICMLAVERQFSGSHTHLSLPQSDPDASAAHRPQPGPKPTDASTLEFDVELGELEREEGIPQGESSTTRHQAQTHAGGSYLGDGAAQERQRAYPLTLGLVVHALADGLALGAAAFSDGANASSGSGAGLSLVVFLALAVHKAPTALALTTSLLSTSLPAAACRRHLAVFSAATPIGTLLSYAFLALLSAPAGSGAAWPGAALLFSGGTFLYVATVLQPELAHPHPHPSGSGDPGARVRMVLMVLGMLTPYVISVVFGDDHGVA